MSGPIRGRTVQEPDTPRLRAPGRECPVCGKRLSSYNMSNVCYSCIEEEHAAGYYRPDEPLRFNVGLPTIVLNDMMACLNVWVDVHKRYGPLGFTMKYINGCLRDLGRDLEGAYKLDRKGNHYRLRVAPQ